MKTNLEDFIHHNKHAFDVHEPSEALWHRLEKKLDNSTPFTRSRYRQTAKVVSVNMKWAAAAVFIIAAAVLFFLTKNPADQAGSLTNNPVPQPDNNEIMTTVAHVPDDTAETLPTRQEPLKNEKTTTPPIISNESSTISKQMYHYSQLIELKQKEIAVIKDRSPQLYNRFLKDLEALEYSYETLREKQKSGINNEQLLEAMILNLKMQANLLNKQLEVSKHIKNGNDDEETNGL